MTTMKVYQAINKVQAEIAQIGVGKNRKNQQQGFMFRSIDDIYDAIASIVARNGLCILPRMLSRECVERTTAKGGALFFVTVEAEFDFVAVEDGSHHTVKTFGEAMDSADKATNKAMSAAHKYALIEAFCIPVVGDQDADAYSPEPMDGPSTPEQHKILSNLLITYGRSWDKLAEVVMNGKYKGTDMMDVSGGDMTTMIKFVEKRLHEAKHKEPVNGSAHQ